MSSEKSGITAGVRIDGGKRRDLNKERIAARMAGLGKLQPSHEDIAANDEMRRVQGLKADKSASKLMREDGGKDGYISSAISVRISANRSERRQIRSRPGTFEWRYGRNKMDALFHAGNHLALLWERAGVAAAKTPDLLGASGRASGGVADARLDAMQELAGARTHIGMASMSRLVDYCVSGMTTPEIARKLRVKERDITTVLAQDLRDCAIHFRFLSSSR